MLISAKMAWVIALLGCHAGWLGGAFFCQDDVWSGMKGAQWECEREAIGGFFFW